MGFCNQVQIMNSKLVISPSGNFYGSEQVLFDYLVHTKLKLDVAVPRNSLFYQKLKETQNHHRIFQYDNKRLPAFYTRVYWWLLKGKYDLVYLNEAGHIKYLILIARFFRSRKFIVHVRMLEDVNVSRWKQGISDNMTVLAVSKYISDLLPVKNSLIYDDYPFSNTIPASNRELEETLRVAIIGRITKTKGLSLLPGLIARIEEDGAQGEYIFELYGEIADDISNDELLAELRQSGSITLKGFEKNKELIFNSVDCVLHLSRQEALGRIFFEAIDHFKPFIGFKAAGIGEIAGLLELNHWLVDPNAQDSETEIYTLLKKVKLNYRSLVEEIKQKKNKAIPLFSPAVYTDRIDKLLSA
jgi:Glycosyl transferases group 1